MNDRSARAHYLLTGAPVFTARTIPELYDLHVSATPAPPSSRVAVPPALDALILRCLAKSPADRPASAAALRAELDALDVPAWTAADADAWWGRFRASAQAAAADVDPVGQTLAVGPAAR